MKTRAYTLRSVCVLALLLSSVPALGNLPAPPETTTNIRGRVVTYNPHTSRYTAVPGARLDLLVYDAPSESWRKVATAYTNAQGYYYFTDLAPQTYKIRVNDRKVYRITVAATEARFQDIPPIRLA